MDINEILKKDISFFLKEKNDKIIKIINSLVEEFENKQKELELLMNEIENTPIEDDFFFKNLKKEEFKKRAEVIEKNIFLIEKKWSELILVLNERFNKNI
jgi:hypothetical protein